MQYVYEGPGPQEDGEGGIVRPLDVREFDSEPDWGPWRLLAPETPGAAPAVQAPAAAPASPPPASPAPPVTTSAPAAPKEM